MEILKGYRFYIVLIVLSQTSCYFFRKHDINDDDSSTTSGVIGEPLGQTAGTLDQNQLDGVYGIVSTHAPAAVRPDPDVFVRRLLLQYREEGATVARQIGRVEKYRLLLGGASADFSVAPQQSYDATSLLAELKVAEDICTGLVAPNANDHPGWATILPYDPANYDGNIRFLAQRLIGLPSADIPEETIASLEEIINAGAGSLSNSSYIIVCATLMIDARSLLL